MSDPKRALPIKSQLEIARESLTQALAYRCRDDWARRRRYENVQQIKRFIDECEAKEPLP